MLFTFALPLSGVKWEAWSSWSSCSAGCGGGSQWRSRSCKSSAETTCHGFAKESKSCNIAPCIPPSITQGRCSACCLLCWLQDFKTRKSIASYRCRNRYSRKKKILQNFREQFYIFFVFEKEREWDKEEKESEGDREGNYGPPIWKASAG